MIIETGIPIPIDGRKDRSSTSIALMTRMSHGDSILFDEKKKAQSFICSISTYKKRRKIPESWQFISRTVSGGIRVWKIVDDPPIPITYEENKWLEACEDMDNA